MVSSYFIEKLKFGEKYVLVNFVVMPLLKPTKAENNRVDDYEIPASNKYLSQDVWQSFVYRKLYDLFRQHLGEDEQNSDRLLELNTEHRFHCADRPYLQLKYEFRDKTYRNKLNVFFKEKLTSLYNNCLYVEISDQGRSMFEKAEDHNITMLRLLNEIEQLKRECSKETISPTSATKRAAPVVEAYHPKPVQKHKKHTIEEYVPETRNGISPGTKETYKPSKIGDNARPVCPSDHDPYTPEVLDTPLKMAYVPSSSPQSKQRWHKKSRTKIDRNLFGSDDDEYDPTSGSAGKQSKDDSQKDMFVDSDRSLADEREEKEHPPAEASPSDGSPTPFSFTKREVLPRNSKLIARLVHDQEIEEKRKSRTAKKIVTSKPDDNPKSLLKLKNGFRKKPGPKKDTPQEKQKKLQKYSEIATNVKRRKSKVEMLDCFALSKENLLNTFPKYKKELRDIFHQYKDRSESVWKSSNDLCYFTELGNILDDDQKLIMLEHLEYEFVAQIDRGKYTEFFTSTLLMEWGLRIFMDQHKFKDRRMALDYMKQQETLYLSSVSTDFFHQFH